MVTSDLAGRRLDDRYVLEEHISSGGMAAVWRAVDVVLGRDVAVKVLHGDLARDDDLLERFRLEAVAAARLGHPAVVRVFDTGMDGGVCYIVMELFRGETAAGLLDRRGRLPTEEAVRIVRTALTGLGDAHAEGVVHRDVKPSNILIGEDATVKVTDFGIAKAAFAGGDLTTTGNLIGTAKYLSPEQVSGEGADARSDLYATGVVLYELLAGEPPFAGETHLATATMRLTKEPKPLRAVRPDVPPAVEAVVSKALARDPGERYQTADEMIAALDRALGTVRPARTPRRERPTRRKQARPPAVFRSWVYVPIALVILAGLVVAGYVLVRELADGGNGNGRADGRTPAGAVEIQDVFDHDPFGTSGEYPELTGNAIDGRPNTAWQTEGYDQPDLDKPGVGLVLDLGDELEIGEVHLHTTLPGWEFELQGSNDAETFSGPLPGVDGETSFEATERDTVVELEPGASYRYMMVWITSLSQDPGGRYRATVAEVEIYPPGE